VIREVATKRIEELAGNDTTRTRMTRTVAIVNGDEENDSSFDGSAGSFTAGLSSSLKIL